MLLNNDMTQLHIVKGSRFLDSNTIESHTTIKIQALIDINRLINSLSMIRS